jgi:hypothetical protein
MRRARRAFGNDRAECSPIALHVIDPIYSTSRTQCWHLTSRMYIVRP